MMHVKVQRLLDNLVDIEKKLSDPNVHADQENYKKLTQQYSQLSELKDVWTHFQTVQNALKENQRLLREEKDPELVTIIQDELQILQKNLNNLEGKLKSLLVPPDPRDSKSIIVEIRAGTGGDEAALFVADVVRMYKNFCEKKGWTVEPLSITESDLGGLKEYTMGLSGKNVFRLFQYEAGTHRVQRVPDTETQGRVHTSAITVAVLLEPDEEEGAVIDEKDLRIETYRASGAGGQHVNTTDSAVRITHIPTNTVVCCQDERSQIKNKEKALRLLKAKVAEEKRRKKQKEISDLRSTQVGSGDRSERIRTYNFPQNRITDHRIDLTLYKLDQIMEGDLDELLNALVSYFYQQKLQA